ncbi:MAG TPA: FAD-dependent monooxygenase [Holophagaceae bacterium]|nr:FAD-dependent monooxygenase [Holophagaceae bacterium]
MRFLISNLPLALGEEKLELARPLAHHLGGKPGDYRKVVLERRSLDARHKGAIRFLATLSFETERILEGLELPPGVKIDAAPPSPPYAVAPAPRKPKVVIVGSGPAGTFCALRLLDYGIEPIVLERGPAMSERVKAISDLWKHAKLNPDANAQFGEGGAGTFSDGKLTTRIGHPATRYVIDTFVRFGAHPRIAFLAKPHVGTDVIRKCSVLIRKDAERRGVGYRWNARLHDLEVKEGRVVAAVLADGERIPCDALVLAPGHSARDTFEMLHRHGVAMRQKPFAMGVRIEHPQDLIDRAQYGPSKGHPSLPPADYKLVCNFGLNRAAYSFCMCPGGEVIQCASEEGGVVVNGMSNEARDSGFANSGLVAKVNTSDFGSEHLLAGMYFQRRWEQAAFKGAGETYGAPAMSVEDLLKGRSSGRLPATSFKPFAVAADLRPCLPDFVLQQVRDALPVFDKKIHGYTSRESTLLAIESRTSSPIQMLRGEDGQSLTHAGLYPCGEGAGFAGGITSAAVDGIRVAEWIAQKAGAPVFQAFEKQIKAAELANEY